MSATEISAACAVAMLLFVVIGALHRRILSQNTELIEAKSSAKAGQATATEAKSAAAAAQARADEAGRDLAGFREYVAREYVSREMFREWKTEILDAFKDVNSRLDRIVERSA